MEKLIELYRYHYDARVVDSNGEFLDYYEGALFAPSQGGAYEDACAIVCERIRYGHGDNDGKGFNFELNVAKSSSKS